ncbi:MAG: biopolymer transporter ExbD [Bacteroidales bacterium]
MAEIQQNEKGGKKGKTKKLSIHIDFTPMVDMNMLLITFFMLCTSLNKPQTMEISMPTSDTVTEEEQNKVKASKAITILLGPEDKIYYYFGIPDYNNYNSLHLTTYAADGLRSVLLQRNAEVVTKVEELKQKKLAENMSEEEFTKQMTEIKKSKTSPVIMIKATDDSNYKNLIDALDEMHICSISQYAIVDIEESDKFLIKNHETAGELTKNIDNSKIK